MLRFTKRTFSTKIRAPPLVYVCGEEMSRWAGELFLDEWIRPKIDISSWQFYDLSCKARDNSDDKVLQDCITAGKKVGAIYKEPTMYAANILIF
jgi:isocitrate dehydrogenase